MSNEQQEELASLYALDALPPEERSAFEAAAQADPDLQALVRGFRTVLATLAWTAPPSPPPPGLRLRVLERIEAMAAAASPPASDHTHSLPSGFRYVSAGATGGWKRLPVPGAWIKLLSHDPGSGYVVLLGKLEPSARYPAHTHAGSEDLYLLSGDLHLGDQVMSPGDFHHSDAGTEHGENFSVSGCTLLAVLSTKHVLAQFALSSDAG